MQPGGPRPLRHADFPQGLPALSLKDQLLLLALCGGFGFCEHPQLIPCVVALSGAGQHLGAPCRASITAFVVLRSHLFRSVHLWCTSIEANDHATSAAPRISWPSSGDWTDG